MQNKKISAPSKKKSKKIDPYLFSKNKIDKYISMIQKTMLSVQKYKLMDVISAGEMSLCIKSLEMLYDEIQKLNYTLRSKNDIDYDDIVNRLQKINNELSSIFRSYGTENLEDLVAVCFGETYLSSILNNDNQDIFDILKAYIHPISYKVMGWLKNTDKNKKVKESKLKEYVQQERLVLRAKRPGEESIQTGVLDSRISRMNENDLSPDEQERFRKISK